MPRIVVVTMDRILVHEYYTVMCYSYIFINNYEYKSVPPTYLSPEYLE